MESVACRTTIGSFNVEADFRPAMVGSAPSPLPAPVPAPSTAAPAFGVVMGSVFLYANHDGVFDAVDTRLSGVRVYIDSNNDGVWGPGEIDGSTNSGGQFGFKLAPGTYRVRVIAPAGHFATVSGFVVNLANGQYRNGPNFALS